MKLSFYQKIVWGPMIFLLLASHVFAYSLQGRFISLDNAGISGITVTASGLSTTTDATGTFKIDGLPEGTYEVVATKSGYKAKSIAGLYIGDNNPIYNIGSKYLVASSNGYRVNVNVTDSATRQLISGATVQIGGLMGTLQGNYYVINLSETNGTVTASKSGYNTVSQGFGVSDNYPVTFLSMSLAEGGYRVKGRVIDINGNPVSGVTFNLQANGGSLGGSVSSGTTGLFEIKGISQDTYSITLTGKKSGYKDLVRSGYYVNTGMATYDAGDLYLIQSSGGYRARGHVLDAKGAGMSGVQVVVTADGQAADSGRKAFTNSQGYYDIAVDSAGNYVLTAQVVNSLSSGSIVVPKEGFTVIQQYISLSNESPVSVVPNCVFSPSTRIGLEANSTRVVKGGEIEFIATVENIGNAPMLWTELKSSPDLPACWSFVGEQADGKASDNSTHPLDIVRDMRTPLNCNLMNDNGGSSPYSRQGNSLAPTAYAVNYPYTGNPTATSLVCRELGTLGGAGSQLPNTTKVKVVVRNSCITSSSTVSGGSGGGSVSVGGDFQIWDGILNFVATGTPICSGGCSSSPVTTTSTVVIPPTVPEVNVELTNAVTQVIAKEEDASVGELSYILKVRNETKKTAIAKDVTLTIRNIPAELSIPVPVFDKGSCRYTSVGKEIQCRLNDLPNGIEVPITLKVIPKKVVPLMGGFEAQLTSQDNLDKPQILALNYSVKVLTRCETNPTCDCSPKPAFCAGIPDLSIVFDDTGSMSEEIGGLRSATTAFINAIATQPTKPSIQLVSFKDNYTHRITTDQMSTLQAHVNSLWASGGADCPENSSGAIDWVVSNTTANRLKDGGRLLLVTDASPPKGIDLDALIKKLVQRGIKVDVLISGDACVADGVSMSTVDAYSKIAAETHGYFAKVFEVNDGTVEGKKKYEDTARQVLFGALFPTILGVDPNKAPQESTLNVNLTAANTNFSNTSQVTFQKGDKSLPVNAVNVVSATQLVANVTLSDTVELGAYDVKVDTKLGNFTETATAKGMLEVTGPSLTPDIISVTPTSVMQNYTTEIELSGAGTHFMTGISKLSFGDEGILVKEITVNSKTSLRATVEITTAAKLGMHSITVTTGNEVAKTPKDLFLVMQESIFAKLKEVTPHRGSQGGLVQITVTGSNTHFLEESSTLKFSGRGITALTTQVLDETHILATLLLDDTTPLGFRDVFVSTGDETAVLLNGLEVKPKGCHIIEGHVFSQDGQAVSNVYISLDGQGAFTDATGYYRINGLQEGEYTVMATADGYGFTAQTLYIGGQNECADTDEMGEIANVTFQAASKLAVKIVAKDNIGQCIKQDGQITYQIITTNLGDQVATGVVLNNLLPEGVSVANLTGANCDISAGTCQLPDLAPKGEAKVLVTLNNNQDRPLVNQVQITSNEYPPATISRWKCVAPHLSVTIKDIPDPVAMQGQLRYLLEVDLSAYAPTPATGVQLKTSLPEGIELKAASTKYGTCDTSNLPSISCTLNDLSIEQASDVSHVTVTLDTVLKDPGLLLLTLEAMVSAQEYSPHTVRERTTIFVPDDVKVDIIFVQDTTESMRPELNGVIKALEKFINGLDPSQFPTMALVEFKDEVTVKAFTTDPNLMLKVIRNLVAEGGNSCPEASAEALEIAIRHLKDEGTIILSTDASPYDDADMESLAALIKDKKMKFHPLITGDCSEGEGSFNELK